jgi:hypothetical protein
LKNKQLFKKQIMKKYLLLPALIACCFGLKAQKAPADTVYYVNDTLHYYFNKFYFKTGTPVSSFPSYKSPASTATGVTHLGSTFENKSPLTITGLEGFVQYQVKNVSLTIKTHLYLCTLTPQGMPAMPPLDSVIITLSAASNSLAPQGGPLIHGPKVVNGDFAVLMRNMSTLSGDTVRILRTYSRTYTNTSVSPVERFSDSRGIVRYAGTFYSATNFAGAGFGMGTDYEFCVAPWVTYSLQASHVVPTNAANVCTWEAMFFQNTSSWQFSHRMYNLCEFARKWNQNPTFATAPAQGWPADSAIQWYFEMADRPLGHPGYRDPRVFLPYHTTDNKISFFTDSAVNRYDFSCFIDNEFRYRWRSMAIYGRGRTIKAHQSFTVCSKYCNNDTVGVSENVQLANLNVYPNPSSDGSMWISGLDGASKIFVYDLLGNLVSADVTSREKYLVDLRSRAAGTYLLKVQSEKGSRTFKVVRNE